MMPRAATSPTEIAEARQEASRTSQPSWIRTKAFSKSGKTLITSITFWLWRTKIPTLTRRWRQDNLTHRAIKITEWDQASWCQASSMAKWASALMIPIQSIWSTIIINSARDQTRTCQCKISLAFTIKMCSKSRQWLALSSISMPNRLSKHNIIQQTKATATHMVEANSMCKVHLCSSISLPKEHSSSCRPPSRSLHSISQAHQGHHTSSHAAKNWMRRTCTSSISNRKNYLTSISTGTRSSYLPVEVVGISASKQQQTLAKMEACWLHNQCSASQWAPRRANSRS